MPKKWTKNYQECRNCGSVRFNHIAKGYCTRCYYIVRKLEQVVRWNLSDSQTLEGYPNNIIFHKSDEFKKIKGGFISQLKDRLAFFNTREKALNGPIYGLDIEYRFRYITRRCRTKNKNLFHGIATYLDHNFSMKQKKILYETLNQIEEDIPWDGIDWYKIFSNKQ